MPNEDKELFCARSNLLRITLAALAMGIFGLSLAVADPSSQAGRLSYVAGAVSFNPGTIDEWTPAVLNYPLGGGDQLWTAVGGRAEVQLRSVSIRLNSGAAVSFLDLDDQGVRLRLTQGSLYIDLRALDQGAEFEIDTPAAALTLVSAGKYRIDVSSRGETRFAVREGWAEVTSEAYVQNLGSGQSAILSGSRSDSFRAVSPPQADEWESWCAARDSLEDHALSGRNVSQEMIGASDLEANGTWFATADYGIAWTPSHAPAAWAPYRFGHWAWDEPWGWTWIDDASWGFAPFHYGRWIYLGNRWAWLPGTPAQRPVYAPALVVFIGGAGWNSSQGDSIGWIALGPREIYIPPYQASVAYIQAINIAYVTTINARIIQDYAPSRIAYANRVAPRGLTVVPREVFASSRPTGARAIDIGRAEASRAPFMGMAAAIVPRRESIIARAPAAAAPIPQPPSELRSLPVYSRLPANPAPVPFAQQQGALARNPGRPLAPADISAMQRAQRAPSPLPVRELPRQARPSPSASPAAAPRVDAPRAPVPQRETPRAGAPQAPVPQAAPSETGSNGSDAISLIAALKERSLPDADRRLAEARKVAGIRLDFNSIASQLRSLRQALANAERDAAAKNFDKALQEARKIQDRLEALVSQIAAAARTQAPAPGRDSAPSPAPRRVPSPSPVPGPVPRR